MSDTVVAPGLAHKEPVSWPVFLLAGGFAAWQTWFFAGPRGQGSQWWGGLGVALVYTAIYLMLLRSRRPAFWRRVFFVTIALVFAPSFMFQLLESRGSIWVSQATVNSSNTPFCHIVIPMALPPALAGGDFIFPARFTGGHATVFMMLLIWLLASVTIGRGWCSWVCFYGGWDDGFSRLAKKPRINLQSPPLILRIFPWVMLAFVVLASMASLVAVYCEWFCPFKLVTESSRVEDFASWLAGILMVCSFVGLVVVMPVLSRTRFQCSVFCPFGALQSLVDRISPFRIRISPRHCTGCMACVRSCPSLALQPSHILKAREHPAITCTKCTECIDACPKGAIALDFRRGKGAGKTTSVPAGRHPVHKRSGNLARALRALGTRLGSLPGSGRAAAMVRELFSPRLLYTTTAYFLGMVVSSDFARDTLGRLVNLVLHGSMLWTGVTGALG